MPAGFTDRLPLSRHRIDRDYLARSRPELFDELLADPTTRVIVLSDGSALLADGGTGLALRAPSDLPTGVATDALLLYLGRSLDDGTAYLAAVVMDATAEAFAAASWGNLRTLGASLGDLEAGLFTEALALANWHESHAFSPRTGQPTMSAEGGWVRRVMPDGDELRATDRDLFPRTDAAIIVGIVDADDRILLGHNAMWPANRYSLLAGFVEPGESLENAVVREVYEESGIRIVDPVYLGSQPWPFPASLMLGFIATVDPSRESTLAADGEEILDLRWFSRVELAASLDEIALPGHASIARAILEHWFGGPIPDRVDW
ncbi:NAD(+) diphosphatase [Marisediminicola senii]|uniref:NAD(+) diphosphatase n=1 Tax=Marisediminicola senii TaxID=2711233 RepID=UPI0013EB2622|nr:NAD(+) diphosphatase [Marisediminicola senii]